MTKVKGRTSEFREGERVSVVCVGEKWIETSARVRGGGVRGEGTDVNDCQRAPEA